MPELPNTYDRRPTPRFGGVRQAAPVVAPGEIAEGQGLQRLGAEVASVFTELQLKADRFELENRTTEYRRDVLNLQREMQQRKSADVAENGDFYQEYTTQHDALKAKHLEKAGNHRVSGALSQRLELGDINFKESLISHINKERDVYNTQVFETGTQVEIENMASKPYNDAEIQQSRDRIVSLTTLYAEQNDLPTEMRDAMIKQSLSKGHIEIISARIDDGEAERAETYFWENKDEIDGTKHNDILKALEKTSQAGRTQQLAGEAYQQFGTDKKAALEYIRENAKPEDVDEALRRLKTRYAEDEQIENDAIEQAGINVRGQYAAAIANPDDTRTPTEIWASIPRTEKLAMKPSELLAMQSRVASDAAGKTGKTDVASYYFLDQQIRNLMKTDPDKAKSMDLSKYQHLISKADLDKLHTLRMKEPKVLQTESQILKEGLLSINLDPTDLYKKGGSGEKARAFQSWVSNNLSADYDKAELEEVTRRGAIKIITDDGVLWDSTEYAYLAGTEFVVPGVPSERVDEYAAALKGMGLSTTIENIVAAHAVITAGEQLSIDNIQAIRGEDLGSGELSEGDREFWRMQIPEEIEFPERYKENRGEGG